LITSFNKSDYHLICDKLASADADLATIIEASGYPPFWSRSNTFETLVHIILEQQVSLASALSALNKLRERTNEISPAALLTLTEQEMKSCYCSRQKTSYIKNLAQALFDNKLNLSDLEYLPDEEVRSRLVALKGIGNWTADVYLMFVLHRADIFPIGDLAAVIAVKRIKQLPADTARDAIIGITSKWKPYRTIATMLLWHYYLSKPKKRTE
jgi:DNA-3-methyladenine glycosylase II